MRHRVKGKKLNTDSAHRRSLAKNLSSSLIENRQITTTLAKAKFIRPYVERLVTRAKKDQSHNTVKYMETKLATPGSVKTLITEIAPLYQNVNGGYVRIVKLKERAGDKAKMARVEFVINKPKKDTGKEDKEDKKSKEEVKKE
jgi:large subunit ribosomal protein L17